MSEDERKDKVFELAKGLRLIDRGDELLRTAPKEEKEKESFKEKIVMQKRLWEHMFNTLSSLGPAVTHSVYSVKDILDKQKPAE